MIKSMTGFARGEIRTKHGVFTVEIRTLNQKFLEMTYKLPNSLSLFDDRVKDLIKNRIKRGKLYLNLAHESPGETGSSIVVDENLAKSYFSRLKKLKKSMGMTDPIKLADVIAFPGVINYRQDTKSAAKMWRSVKAVIEAALKKLIKDREREGSFLLKDIMKRKFKIGKIVSGINKNSASEVKNYKKRLSERVKEISGGYAIDRGRLEMEVALFAKNSDITEEITRLNNHLNNFSRTVRKSGEVGKKLDFIAQELHREINTVGAKSSSFEVSKGVIEAKTEIEKIREQLKNIE